jgi:hypothetical protein
VTAREKALEEALRDLRSRVFCSSPELVGTKHVGYCLMGDSERFLRAADKALALPCDPTVAELVAQMDGLRTRLNVAEIIIEAIPNVVVPAREVNCWKCEGNVMGVMQAVEDFLERDDSELCGECGDVLAEADLLRGRCADCPDGE